MYLIRRSHFAIPGRDGPVILEQSQRYHSCLLIRVKMLVKQSKLIENPATTNNEWMTSISQPGPSPVTGQLLQSSPRAKKLYSLITTFREIHKYPWDSQISVRFTNIREIHKYPWDSQISVSLEKLPKSVRLTGNPWDLTGLIYIYTFKKVTLLSLLVWIMCVCVSDTCFIYFFWAAVTLCT